MDGSSRAGPEREVPHGELHSLKPLQFTGRDRTHSKRKALDFWFQNRDRLGMTLRHFFARCRLSPDGRTITFFY